MKINIDALRHYIELPADIADIRDLMEDIGLEVKRADGNLFTLELLANRGDHHCYTGIAREIHGRTGWTLIQPETMDIDTAVDTSRVSVTTEDCFNYTLTVFKKTGTESGLNPIQASMLEAAGTNTVSPAVDITNFVNIEIGQPLHAFDADKVKGKITVRAAIAGDRAQLLFTDHDVDVPAGTIVIADEEKILAIAGVMGCETSKPDDTTTTIYLECATFDPVKVRTAARHFAVQSQSSMRFERGADPDLAVGGVKRAARLLTAAGWTQQGAAMLAKTWDAPVTLLPLETRALNDYFETALSDADIIGILSRYGFATNETATGVYDVIVPSYRMWDVKEPHDVYEEIARAVGYDKLPASLPPMTAAVHPLPTLARREKIEDIFVSEGFFEVFTDGFYGDAQRRKLCANENAPLYQHVNVVNAGDKAYSLLKNNNLIQAMDLVTLNVHVKNPHVKAYEWTRTFHPDKNAENGVCEEKQVLWAIADGAVRTPEWKGKTPDVDVFYLKGIVAEIAAQLEITLDVRQSVNDDDMPAVGAYLHPGRRAGVYLNGVCVGVIGEVHPETVAAWGLKSGRPCFIELSQDILDAQPESRRYIPPSHLQQVVRDVCLVLPSGVHAGGVADVMQRNSGWLSAVRVHDVFNAETTDNLNAVTFSLVYDPATSGKSGFTGDEINAETERLVTAAIAAHPDVRRR